MSIFLVLLGIGIFCLSAPKKILAACTPTGITIYDGCSTLDPNTGAPGYPCHQHSHPFTVTCGSGCTYDLGVRQILCNTTTCTEYNGSEVAGSCASTCTPGQCNQNLGNSCFSVAGSCYRDGWNGCASCTTSCPPSLAGCSNQACPTSCGYGGGSVQNGTVNGDCSCGTKGCAAIAPCATPTPTPTPIPTPTPEPSNNYFDIVGDGGYPGIPSYGASTNLTQTNVSVTGWMANSGYNATKVYNSDYFLNVIPEGTTINTLTSSIDGSAIASGGTESNGIFWYEYYPLQHGGLDLTINTAADVGSRKVILIVNGANVYLNGNINLTKGSGFFMLVAGAAADGTKGNIIVNPSVGGGVRANLEGIYIADGVFQTGTTGTKSDIQLWIRGSVAAYGGVNLQRDLGDAVNSTTPAELFEFAPDLELLFPEKIGTRTTNWQEVAP